MNNLGEDEEITYRVRQFIGQHRHMLDAGHTMGADSIASNGGECHAKITSLPPLEMHMSVPEWYRRRHLCSSLRPDMVFYGEVTVVQASGVVISVLCLEEAYGRYLTQTNFTVFCPNSELPRNCSREDPNESLQTRDKVAGIVLSTQDDKVFISLNDRHLPEEKASVRLGLVSEDDLPLHYKLTLADPVDYQTALASSPMFRNMSTVRSLCRHQRLQLQKSYSLLHTLNGVDIDPDDYADELRRRQILRMSLKWVAKGIRLFKENSGSEALRCYNYALNIDPRNSEAFVARGAFEGTCGNFEKAVADFRAALELSPEHGNARKYMARTLIAMAKARQDAGELEYAEALLLKSQQYLPDNAESKAALEELHYSRQQSHQNAEAPMDVAASKEAVERLLEAREGRTAETRAEMPVDDNEHDRPRRSRTTADSAQGGKEAERTVSTGGATEIDDIRRAIARIAQVNKESKTTDRAKGERGRVAEEKQRVDTWINSEAGVSSNKSAAAGAASSGGKRRRSEVAAGGGDVGTEDSALGNAAGNAAAAVASNSGRYGAKKSTKPPPAAVASRPANNPNEDVLREVWCRRKVDRNVLS